MPLSTRAFQTKMKSVSNIGKITRAMEMVAASKMKKAVDAAVATRTYAELALNLLVNLAKDRAVIHPLVDKGPGERRLVVIVASNKGLCGGYNSSVERGLRNWLEAKEFKPVDFVCIGKQAERIAKHVIDKAEGEVIASFTEISDQVELSEIASLNRMLLDEYQEKKNYRKIYILYTQYQSALKQEPIIRQLMPIREQILVNMLEELGADEDSPEFEAERLSRYVFEPSAEEVLDQILPRLVEVQLYQSILEADASEQSARMVAMRNATENAGELLDDLKLGYNRVRQEGVTREISEIAAGADALAS